MFLYESLDGLRASISLIIRFIWTFGNVIHSHIECMVIRPKKANGKEQNVYWIRKKVPARYRTVVGKTEVWRSPKTTDRRTANAKITAVSEDLPRSVRPSASAVQSHVNRVFTFRQTPSQGLGSVTSLRSVNCIMRTRPVVSRLPGFCFSGLF